ncbi:MAG TPA: M3 family metallopeptidase, partial [Opitutaceae bacterium]|nr:M3 family metallopeptidase [Opitutaceae bacterium]
MAQSNPFLDPTFPIRWSELTAEQIEPSIGEALQQAEAHLDAIRSLDVAAVTYENTFLALEEATLGLSQAWHKVTHLQSVADSPALRAAHNAMLPRVSAFFAKIPLDPKLWQRLKAFESKPEAKRLGGIHQRFFSETLADFRQAGADLPDAARARLEAVQTELAELTQKYSENVLDATNAWQLIVEDESRLAGLPEHAKAAARRSAESKQIGTAESPRWRFTLHAPSQEPLMTYGEDAALREESWKAAIAVGAAAPFDNTDLIQRILKLRAEKASLLGKAHFADSVLERRMAKSGERALAFVEDLRRRSAGAFAKEIEALEQFRALALGTTPRRLAPWELAFWAEKLRREQYAFDEEVLRPYFPLPSVIDGLFELCRRVFGLTVKELPTSGPGAVETWHPEVKVYEMHDAEGRHVGSFYADWFPRESKRGGAWMNYLITGGPLPDGGRAPHIGLICGNLTPPAGERPALLTHREVETVFHEFGHLLHHLLGEVEIKSLNGVNVAWDFVELPSQIMENWCWERPSLDLFARHYQSGSVIPEDIFKKMIAAKNFRAASAMMRQLAFAKMDLLLHIRAAEFAAEPDAGPKARAAVADCLIPTRPPAPT